MELTNTILSTYAEAHSETQTPLLEEIVTYTEAHVPMAGMLSGRRQGRLLSMISSLMSPTYILELGTFTGFSALCLAEGLQEGGKLITIDANKTHRDLATAFFERSERKENIYSYLGNAKEVLPSLENGIDLVYIDADKENYLEYYHLILPKVRAGGLIIADNVLWGGKVLDEVHQDEQTQALRAYNTYIREDKRVRSVMLLIRDGLLLSQKK